MLRVFENIYIITKLNELAAFSIFRSDATYQLMLDYVSDTDKSFWSYRFMSRLLLMRVSLS